MSVAIMETATATPQTPNCIPNEKYLYSICVYIYICRLCVHVTIYIYTHAYPLAPKAYI